MAEATEAAEPASPPLTDHEMVTALLGREPTGAFTVVVRGDDGVPVVIRNEPVLESGRPMTTRYWLVGQRECLLVGRLESAGGVRRAEAEVDPADLRRAHDDYAVEREQAIPADHDGHRPSHGVAGTRQGVKCLHAHYANFLAGADDPVGAWVHDHLDEVS